MATFKKRTILPAISAEEQARLVAEFFAKGNKVTKLETVEPNPDESGKTREKGHNIKGQVPWLQEAVTGIIKEDRDFFG